jgi:hypothetical protein
VLAYITLTRSADCPAELTCRAPAGTARHRAPNPLGRVNAEIKGRTEIVGIVSNEARSPGS